MTLRFRIIILVFVLATGMAGDLVRPNLGIAQEPTDGAEPIHIVTATNPDARIRRQGWSGFSNLSLGASLQFRDLVDPGEGAIRILCADLTERTVTRLGAVPCPQERSVLIQADSAVAVWQRGAIEDITVPFLVAPRATAVLTPQPLIRWNPIPNVEGYRIVVRGDAMNWSADVMDPETHELLYPDDAPALDTGASYTVEIIAVTSGGADRSSREEDGSGLSFTVMTPEGAQAIQKSIVQIHDSIQDENIAALVDVRFYAQNDLLADALQALFPIAGDVVDTGCPTESSISQSPVVYLLLGDLYLRSQLERYAAIAYSCALDLAVPANDLESQALAAMALARLTLDDEERLAYLVTALDSWQALGADTQIKALQEEFELDQ